MFCKKEIKTQEEINLHNKILRDRQYDFLFLRKDLTINDSIIFRECHKCGGLFRKSTMQRIEVDNYLYEYYCLSDKVPYDRIDNNHYITCKEAKCKNITSHVGSSYAHVGIKYFRDNIEVNIKGKIIK